MTKRLEGKTILVGVTGGIACYKAAELTRELVKAGATVQVARRGLRESDPGNPFGDERGFLGALAFDRDVPGEIGAGLGPMAGKAWRIGLMGHSASERNVRLVLAAIKSLLA